jgi:threonine/homoserine/homoserine lactone efflux protein
LTVEQLWLFAVLVFGIIVLPGADMAFVIAHAVKGGTSAGFVAIAGIVAGGVVYAIASALGFGLLLQQFPSAFNAMLIAGCIYVFWMGMSLLRGQARGPEIASERAPQSTQTFPGQRARGQIFWGRIFCGAFVTCLLNPKAYAFMLAVFPQFLRADRGAIAAQATAMSAIIAINQVLIYGSVCLLAVRARHGLGTNLRAQTLFAKSVGALLLLTAVWAVLSGWRST